jgi:hypothetical protein
VRKWIWIAASVLGGLMLVVAGGVFALYRASQQVPEFYQEALQADPAIQTRTSDHMLQKAADLASDLKREGQWQALFTAEEINGWLAVDLVQNHPHALPPGVSQPRVAIGPQEMMLACRLRREDLSGVLSLTIEPYVAEPNVIAVRIRKVRLGALPLPLKQVLDQISQAARQMDFHLQWQQADGDPVALISVPPPRDEKNQRVQVENLRLGEGEIFVSGTTARRQ